MVTFFRYKNGQNGAGTGSGSLASRNGVRFTYRQASQASSHAAHPARTLPVKRAPADPEAMARRPRLDLPGIPPHIVQRSNNRPPCFLDDDDRRALPDPASRSIARHRVQTPRARIDGQPRPSAGDATQNRSHRSSHAKTRAWVCPVVQRAPSAYRIPVGRPQQGKPGYSESYVLHCHSYIKLNPVHARTTDDPDAFPWSSCATHCGLRSEAILSPHSKYTALASPSRTARPTYRKLLPETLSEDDLKRSESIFNNSEPWAAMTSAR